MNIIIKDEATGKQYKVRPVSLGFEVVVKHKDKWNPCHCYTSGIQGAVYHALEMCLRGDDASTFTITPATAAKEISNAIDERVNKIMVEIEDKKQS